jgi:NAD(P)-dependent dehydrogenase (short-subunit alcohol dehydrogenase family)
MGQVRPYTLVTGASSGIGRAVAERLSRDRPLVLHGRDLARLNETRQACNAPDWHLLWPMDLGTAAPVAHSLAELLAAHPVGVQSFVHCAGVAHVLPARSAGPDAVQASLNVNYVSAQQIISTLLKKRLNGAILSSVVLISSIWSRYGSRGHSLYCASKAALDGMMRALAIELAPVVRVNSVLPGAVRTPMADAGMSDPEISRKLQQDYPLGTGESRDIAGVVEFLLSENARWITGQQIVVDGGRTVNMSLK